LKVRYQSPESRTHHFPFSYDEISRWHQYYVALYQQLIYYALTFGSLSELSKILTLWVMQLLVPRADQRLQTCPQVDPPRELPAMVLHNPNNWHWVNKDASAWTKQFLEENIKDLKAEEGGVTAKLDKLISMDGDVDVNQRKGKVITIFDVKLVIEYSGRFNAVTNAQP
jgi:hypothetical protein